MIPTRPRRIALLLTVACALVALTAGVAIGASHRASDHGRGTDRETIRLTASGDTLAPGLRPIPSWASGDIISVRGRKCPRSHPKKIGSDSSSSATQVNGGPVRRRSSHRVVCAR